MSPKKRFTLMQVLVVSFLFLFCALARLSEAVVATPGARQHQQQDGSVVIYQLSGDEFLSFITDEQGNLIALGPDGDFYFADWLPQATPPTMSSMTPFVVPGTQKAIGAPAAIPDDLLASKTMAPLKTPIPEYIIESAQQARQERDEAWSELQQPQSVQPQHQRSAAAMSPAANPTIEKSLLVIYVKFSDQSNLGVLENRFLSRDDIYNQVFNENQFGTVAHYYQTVTGGAVRIKPLAETYGTPNDGIVEVTIAGQHPDTRQDFSTEHEKIILPVLRAADPYVAYDQATVDLGWGFGPRSDISIMMIVQGFESTSGAMPGTHPSIWPHALSWNLLDEKFDNVGVSKYCVVAAYQDTNSPSPATIGVMAHELGHHLFGFADLYLLGNSAYGISDFWSLMGAGDSGRKNSQETTGATPMGLDAYHLAQILPPTMIKEITDLNLQEHALTGLAQIAKLTPNTANPKEYFLLQARGDVGYDRGLHLRLGGQAWPTPGGGLMIYHIDENYKENASSIWRTHPLFDIEEAHGGGQHLQYDTGTSQPNDLFSASKPLFGATSDPNSNLYDGPTSTTQTTPSNIQVSDINPTVTGKDTETGTVTVTFKVGTTTAVVWPTGLSLSATSLSLFSGDTATLIPTFTPSNTSNQLVTWTSDNPNIASVAAGLVTAKAFGTTTIRATSVADTNIAASCTINVTTTRLVAFQSATADGSASAASTKITLVLSEAITNLTADKITLTIGTGTATKGVVTGSGTNWTIALTNVSATGTISVSIADFGVYVFTGSPKTVTVYQAPPVISKIIIVSAQNGTLEAGTAGKAVFTVTTSNILGGAGLVLNNPGQVAGVALETQAITAASTLVTIATTSATPAGSHSFTLTVDGVTSAPFTLTVGNPEEPGEPSEPGEPNEPNQPSTPSTPSIPSTPSNEEGGGGCNAGGGLFGLLLLPALRRRGQQIS